VLLNLVVVKYLGVYSMILSYDFVGGSGMSQT
jgi:hypothetical protein